MQIWSGCWEHTQWDISCALPCCSGYAWARHVCCWLLMLQVGGHAMPVAGKIGGAKGIGLADDPKVRARKLPPYTLQQKHGGSMVMASECSMGTAALRPPPLVGPLACSLAGRFNQHCRHQDRSPVFVLCCHVTRHALARCLTCSASAQMAPQEQQQPPPRSR